MGLSDNIKKNKEREAIRDAYARRTGSIASAAQQYINDDEYERRNANSTGQPSVKFDEIGTGGAYTFPAARVSTVSVPQSNPLGVQPIAAPTTENHVPYYPKQDYVGADPLEYAYDVRSRQLGGASRFVQPKQVVEQPQQVVQETKTPDTPVVISNTPNAVAQPNVVETTAQPATQVPSQPTNVDGVEHMVITPTGDGGSVATMDDGTKYVEAGDGRDGITNSRKKQQQSEQPKQVLNQEQEEQSIADKQKKMLDSLDTDASTTPEKYKLQDGTEVELTDEQKKKIDYDNFVNLAKSGATQEDLAQFLAVNPHMYGYLMDAYRDAAEELDPKKKADREKKDRLERNLVGIANMIGALGNLFNATSSNDGRSVNVEPLSSAVAKKQDKEKADRKSKLDLYKNARLKYGDYLNNLYAGIKARNDKNAAIEKKYKHELELASAKNKEGLTPEQKKEKSEIELSIARAKKREAEAKAALAEGKLEGEDFDKKKKQLEYDAALSKYEDDLRKKNYVIPDANGGHAKTIPLTSVNITTAAGAWDIISKDKELRKYITENLKFKKVRVVKDNEGNDIEMPDLNDNTSFNMNKDEMMAAVGIALVSGSTEVKRDLVNYLTNLDVNSKNHRNNPYGSGGTPSIYGDQ